MESTKKRKILVEKVEILDESTGQIILKEQARLIYNNESDTEQSLIQINPAQTTTIQLIDNLKEKQSDSEDIVNNSSDIEYDSINNKKMNLFNEEEDDVVEIEDEQEVEEINLLDELNTTPSTSQSSSSKTNKTSLKNKLPLVTSSLPQQIIIIESSNSQSSPTVNSSLTTNKQSVASSTVNSGLSSHILQNYSILAHEITSPLNSVKSILLNETKIDNNNKNKKNAINDAENNSSDSTTTGVQQRAQKDIATCQFCGRAMLKKNIPTHIRRAHTPKEELVCLNEEQNIFTFQHLKPGQRRKRSARAYDYSLMTATVSFDEDPCEGIENKFITEGEEILSSDLLQLADRIKYGISQIATSTLTKLIDILGKIETSNQDEVSANAKSIRNMIFIFLTSGEEFKYKLRQVGDDITEKKKQVNSLRADLKEVMSRKAQLERRIQPLVIELQKLEDQHGNLIESINQLNDHYQFEYVQDIINE